VQVFKYQIVVALLKKGNPISREEYGFVKGRISSSNILMILLCKKSKSATLSFLIE